MPTQVSTRLDPAIFRLPVERIRDGYYSDAYFVLTKQLLEAEGDHPRVTMQVFQKRALAARRDRRGDRDPQAVRRARAATATWVPGWDELDVHALHEGDRDRAARDGDDDRGRLQPVRPSGDRLSRARWRAAR